MSHESRAHGQKDYVFKANLKSAPAFRANFDNIFRRTAKCRDCGAEVLEKTLKDGVCETCTKPLEIP